MSASSESRPIVNDYLAFLQEKEKLLTEGKMDVENAVRLNSWASSFSVDDICQAKQVLCQSLGIIGTYIPHRKGDETGEKSRADIQKILREYRDRIPVFVATGASVSPSNVPANIDVRCLFEDIVALKTSLAEVIMKFEAAQETISELRKEVDSLRKSAPTRTVASNFKSVDRPASGNNTVRLRVADTVKRAAPAVPPPACPPRVQPTIKVSSSRQRRSYVDVASQPVAADEVKSSRTDVNMEEFTLVQRKRKPRRTPRKSFGGAAEPCDAGLRVATPSTALYVSRLHYSAVVEDVVEYVRRKTGYSLRVHQLRSRHYVHFSSFVVRVPRPLWGTVASPDFWQKGVVFRRFRGSLPNPTPDRMTQRSHAVAPPTFT